MKIERKYIELKADLTGMGDDGNGWITGYANVKNVVDRVGDKVVDGAYKELDSLVKDGWGSCSHDWSEAIGTIAEAREDAKGLWIKIEFHSDDDSQKIRTRCQERKARGKSIFFSIGYETLEYTKENIDGNETRILKAIKVYEVSIVLAPANEFSEADGLKDLPQTGSPAGLPFGEHFDSALAAVSEVSKRFESYKGLKQEENRKVSAERLAQAKALHEQLGELIAGCEEKQSATESEAQLIELRWLETRARQSGLIS